MFVMIAVVTVEATACIPSESYSEVARNAETIAAFLCT
jgi:hypothetical protein